MILHSLRALNFKKFREINLQDLPARGLVGVVGPNEGGKSSVVDAITFALFGRTPGADVAGTESLIHWEEDLCQVEIVFELPDGAVYRLFREIDRMGDHLTQLLRLPGAGAPVTSLPAAMASLTLDDAGDDGKVSGSLRVARELRRLLGYSYEDFRHSFYLAQAGGDGLGRVRLSRPGVDALPGTTTAGATTEADTVAGSTPDWSGVLFRMTGIDKLGRAIRKGMGVAESIQTELRQVEIELETQGRVMAALGVELQDETALKRDIGELESELARTGSALEQVEHGLGHARQGIVQRAETARELGGLALAVLRARVAAKVAGLAGGLEARQSGLGNERAAVAGECDSARRCQEKVSDLRRLVEELADRVNSRRQEVESQLDTGGSQSLVDRREELSCEARALRGGGRTLMVTAIVLLVMAGAGGTLLALGPNSIPLPFAVTPGQLQGTASGLAIVGLILLLIGVRRRNRSQQECSSRQVELEEIDQTIVRRTSEREFLRHGALEIARDPAAMHLEDERLQELVRSLRRQHQGFLDRQLPLDEYAGQLKQSVEEAEVRLRHLDASAERLDHLCTTAAGLAADLRQFARHEPLAEPIDNIDLGALEEAVVELKQRAADLSRRLEGDDRPLSERLVKLHAIIDNFGSTAGERLQELDASLNATQVSDETDHHLVTKIDAVLDTLPGEAEQQQVVETLTGATAEHRRRQTEVETRLEERRAELKRLEPQFERRRTVEEEVQALMSNAADLKEEVERERAATRLLQGTADQLRSRLAPMLGRSLGRRLGRMTGGRYSRVSVDLDFGLHIYSDERNGFIDPAELSGGTHDQLLLALRLAFAEVLLASRSAAAGPHLLLLDEPLDSFDADRARHLLSLLREGDGALTQVILLANQDLVADACDLIVRTSIESQTLLASGKATGDRLVDDALAGDGLASDGLIGDAPSGDALRRDARTSGRPDTFPYRLG